MPAVNLCLNALLKSLFVCLLPLFVNAFFYAKFSVGEQNETLFFLSFGEKYWGVDST
jgi:hypothetical protein